MAITVDELLKKTFSQRTAEEQVKIISGQKPRPSLRVKYRNEKGFLTDVDFNTQVYDKTTWLTACEKTQKMFCWPCLLMMPQTEWNSGIDDMEFIIKNSLQHEKEPEHLEAVLKLHTFVMNKFQNPSSILNPQSNEDSVSILDNDSVLRLLIESICHAIQMTNSNSNKFTCNRLEIIEAVKYLRLLKPNIPHVDNLIDILINSPETVNRLVNAITVTLKVAIENEIKQSNYVSVILSEHVLNKEKSQISTVFRYVKNGEVHERFVGFTNSVGFKLQYKDVAEHFLKLKKEYHCRGKVLSLTVDGAVLHASQLLQLFALDNFHCKYFVPCYFHEFGRVLIQSVYHLEDCGLFFRTLNAIQSYFENEGNFIKFEAVLLSEIPQLKNNKWYTTAPFITFLNMYRKHFVDYFDQEQTFSKYLSREDRINLVAFKIFLENLKTIFLLKVFGKLFLNYLEKNMNFILNIFDTSFDREIMKFKSNAQKLQTDGFTELWVEAVVDKIGEKATESEKACAIKNPVKRDFIALFEKILNQVVQETEFRQKDVLKLQFCDLLLKCNDTGTLVFKERLVSLLLFEFPSDFEQGTLESEMTIVKRDPGHRLKNKKVHDFMKTFKEYNLSNNFSQLYKLAELILAMPILPPTTGLNYKNTKLKEIENFSYIPQDEGRPPGDTSILCVEKHMLKDLQCLESFYNDAIKKYHVMKKMGWV